MIHPRLARIARRSLLAALLALAGAPARAQAPADCPPAAQAPSAERLRSGLRDARDHGFLWRIAKDGRTSWLFGTLHVARFEWMFPGPRVGQALNASDTVALELDLLDADVRRRMQQGLAAPDAAPLPPLLAQRVERRAAAECLPPQSLSALAPELQVASLTGLAGRREGLDPNYGIDLYLAGWAHAAGKTVVSLETPEAQLRALRMDSPAETQAFVESALGELESGRAAPVIARLARAWADADLESLGSYEAWCDCTKTAIDRAAMKRLLDDRNPALADAIDALHGRGQRVFAAVGSLHMIGPQGLPALLAQRGYRVERVRYGRRRGGAPPR